jgi:hypothetical protein
MSTLDEAQRTKVGEWIKQGLTLSEIQNRLAAELNLRMTYMEVRLLVDDLKLTPKDKEPSRSSATLSGPGPASTPRPAESAPLDASTGAPAASANEVTVTVDQLARPGSMVSGKVTFSDGKQADWYLDQSGQLGLVSRQAGYRPPAADVPKFQKALDAELSKIGF